MIGDIKDLKKTNFTLGGDSNKNDQSIYYVDYRPWKANQGGAKDNLHKFQKTNLLLGEDQHANNYISTNVKDFVAHKAMAPSRLNEEKKNDLRTHHFQFGT
jgi:hypothetical protein